MRRLCIALCSLCLVATVWSAEKTASEKAIERAIAGLEADRDKAADAIEQSKIDKAIRGLEELIEDSDAPDKSPATDKVTVALRKKLAGKVVWKEKTGELTVAYDFSGKPQLADFEVGNKRVLIVKKVLGVEAGDDLKHIAKFKTFTVEVTMGFKAMNGPGIGSSNGSWFTTGGSGQDAIYASTPDGGVNGKVVPDRVRRGSIPVAVSMTENKLAVKYARSEVVTAPTNRADAVHQVMLRGGPDGCGFQNLVITGVPDPKWLKEITEE